MSRLRQSHRFYLGYIEYDVETAAPPHAKSRAQVEYQARSKTTDATHMEEL